jgi:N-glycosylase/DNA lyase
MEFTLTIPKSEFDLTETVTSGQTFLWRSKGSEWSGIDGKHRYWVDISEHAYHVAASGSRADFESYFRLSDNLQSFRNQVADSLRIELCELPNGLRLINSTDPVGTIFSFLCTPNNHLSRISSMVQWFLDNSDRCSGFCSLDRIASTRVDELRLAKFGYRSQSIVDCARRIQIMGGEHYLAALHECSYQEALTEVCSWPGVGPKVGDCICLYALGFTEAVPVDTHLWQSVVRWMRPDWNCVGLTTARHREIGEMFRSRFGYQAGWAQLLLYRANQLRGKGSLHA